MEKNSSQEITANIETIQAIFTEWDRRYRNDPNGFMSEVEHLLRETPDSYGKACAAYFSVLLNAIRSAA